MVICGIFCSRNKGLRSEQWWPMEESFWLFLHSLALVPMANILGQWFVKGTWTTSQISELLELSDLGWYTFILCRGWNRCFEKTRFPLLSLSLSFIASWSAGLTDADLRIGWISWWHEPSGASLARWNLWPESMLYYIIHVLLAPSCNSYPVSPKHYSVLCFCCCKLVALWLSVTLRHLAWLYLLPCRTSGGMPANTCSIALVACSWLHEVDMFSLHHLIMQILTLILMLGLCPRSNMVKCSC